MPDRHLRILSDAARVAARRLRDHRGAGDANVADADHRNGELERSADRAHRRFNAAVPRRASTGKT
jgi:hypothetical protein